MLGDHPTLVDRLNRQTLIETKARQIVDSHPPQTFGVHGDWGAGKTSFLRQLRYYLDGNADSCRDAEQSTLEKGRYKDQVVTVWFDAWQYQHEPAPVIALLHEIRRQFDVWLKIKSRGKKIIDVTTRSLLNSLSDIAKLMKLETLPVKPQDIQKEGENYEKRHLETKLGVDTIQEYLQESIKSIIKGKKLVIIIDDLDRCSSSAAYRLLEGLKIYLNLNNCVFVLGMNQKIIVDAIAKELTLYDNTHNAATVRIYAEAYLEKLCSSIERLTPPTRCEQLFIDWADQGHRLALTDALIDPNQPERFIRCLPPNPRRIKALANLLNQWLRMPRIQAIIDEIQPYTLQTYQSLIVTAYVYQFHSEIYQRWQFTPDFFRQLNRWAIRPWKTATGENSPEQPDYLACLELPNQVNNDTSSTTPSHTLSSNYPDPYAINIFWVQPLLFAAQLQVDDINRIMAAITAHEDINE